MRIVIPSMSRAATMTTQRLVPSAVVCVPESQAVAYREAHPAMEVVTHPDTVRGLTPKLNWCLEHLDDGDAIVFLDDDLTTVRRNFLAPGEPGMDVRDPALILDLITNVKEMAADLGVYLFGWNAANEGVRYFTGMQPFRLTGALNGSNTGVRSGSGLRYDERVVAKNDFDICAMNAFRYRMLLKDERYSFVQTGTFTALGGQSAHRTSDTEERDVRLLLQKYGEDIVHRGGRSGVRRRDYAGAQKVTLHIPF